ncbi:MAG TPA: septum formation initiator family protein [Candidatus Angelobacter sp.]|nr:septum formation initiator family protein [Candidatus Angelobacter sp.]
MQELFQNGRNWLIQSRRKVATCGVGILVCLMAGHVVFGANGLLVYHQKRQEYRQLQEQIESFKRQNQALEQQIKGLKTDPKTIEKEAREQLRYARPGEVIYTLPAPKAAAPVAPSTAQK